MEQKLINGAMPVRWGTNCVSAPQRWKRSLCHLLATAAVAVAVCVVAPGTLEAQVQTTTTKEYKVKATYLFNFAQFVEWPATVFADANAPIIIGVLGDDEFGPFLDQIVQGEKIKNRPLIVKRSRTVAELKACHILFISKSEEPRLAAILASLAQSSVLTLGEVEGFAQRGGIINFFLDGEKLRFEINTDAADRCGLRIRSQLLSLSKIVATAKDKEHK